MCPGCHRSANNDVCRSCGQLSIAAVYPGSRTYDLTAVGIAASVGLVLTMLGGLAYFLFPVSGAAMVDAADPTSLLNAEMIEGLLGVAYLLALITTAVLVMVWLYRARRNLDAFPGANPKLASGWAIGGWLLPIVNLVYPWRMVTDASHGSLQRSQAWLVNTWWAAWLTFSIGERVFSVVDTDRYEALPATPSQPADFAAYAAYYRAAIVPGLLLSVVMLAAGAMLIVLINRISRGHEDRIAVGPPPYPPPVYGAPGQPPHAPPYPTYSPPTAFAPYGQHGVGATIGR